MPGEASEREESWVSCPPLLGRVLCCQDEEGIRENLEEGRKNYVSALGNEAKPPPTKSDVVAPRAVLCRGPTPTSRRTLSQVYRSTNTRNTVNVVLGGGEFGKGKDCVFFSSSIYLSG